MIQQHSLPLVLVLAACASCEGASPQAQDAQSLDARSIHAQVQDVGSRDAWTRDAEAFELDAGLPSDAPAPGPDASVPEPCDALPASEDLESWRAATLLWLQQNGNPAATSERQSGDSVALDGFRAPLGTGDVGPAGIAWLAAIPNFPVSDPSEMVVLEYRQPLEDFAMLVIGRSRVGATEARFFLPLAGLALSRVGSAPWGVASVQVWASTARMDSSSASTLVACTPNEMPPPEPARAQLYAGLNMVQCSVVGSYEYLPNELDEVSFDAGVDWIVRDSRWVVRRRGSVLIGPDNYWPDIEQADCYCNDIAGFDIEVDATTGELLEWVPGVLCVVC